eukprot:CAMPEP_0196583172 /NCGR_PEP_ID=MMETSP1081-20130531/42374_1 /TAXON_ID=36882 /ORGANISM="Pyramimonas amylifera, Strain CCMP720" /LENGTH=305 /DNA_ID=CAMNT_0041903981 /DNA_START=136 /DNA_END=1050 /DNA_ORIENTATION=+
MADRTGEFRQIAVQRAKQAGMNEAKLTKFASEAILPRVIAKSDFEKSSRDVSKSLITLHNFVWKNRPVFLHPERASDRERDNIEIEVSLFVKACKERIDQLQLQIQPNTDPGHTNKNKQTMSTHLAAHLQGVVLILSERLRAVTEVFDDCRAARFKDSLRAWDSTSQLRKEVASHSQAAGHSAPKPRTSEDVSATPSFAGAQQQKMSVERDGAMLVKELEGLVDQVRETEGRVVEISTLNHLFSTQIVQQAAQIEKLYQNAIEATIYMDKGNVQLQKAVSYNSSGRKYFIIIILMAALLLLFMDW